MKRSIFFLTLFIITLAASCDKLEREVVSNWTDEQPKLVAYYQIEGKDSVKIKEEKFYEDGTMEFTGSYDADGKRNGLWKYWYSNGKLWSEGEFANGKRNGKADVFFEHGQMRYKGQFTNDKESGKWVFYNEDGTVYNEIDFDNYEKAKAPKR